jgi:hypothetical protein
MLRPAPTDNCHLLNLCIVTALKGEALGNIAVSDEGGIQLGGTARLNLFFESNIDYVPYKMYYTEARNCCRYLGLPHILFPECFAPTYAYCPYMVFCRGNPTMVAPTIRICFCTSCSNLDQFCIAGSLWLQFSSGCFTHKFGANIILLIYQDCCHHRTQPC